ncbi:MAG: T9SS type A sorting domain-containing protein [Luteibaculum sp.]
MKKFYKLFLGTAVMALLSVASFGQCPTFDITNGGYEVGGNDFVCDGTNVTVTWNDVPGATGYRLRVGNDAVFSNLDVSYVAPGTDPGPTESSTFAVPAATNGNFYSYVVDYSVDGTWTLGNAPSRTYVDCGANVESFKVSVDPTAPTTITLAGGDNISDVCSGINFSLTASGGVAGDIATFEWDDDMAFGSPFAETSATLTTNITTGTTFYVRRIDDCGVVTGSTSLALTVSGGPLDPITESVQTIISGATVCPGSANPDLTFNSAGDGIGSFTADIEWRLYDVTGAEFQVGPTVTNSTTFDVDLDLINDVNKDFEVRLYNNSCPYSASVLEETFSFSTIDAPTYAATFDGFTVNEFDGAQTINAGNTTVTICDGEDLIVDMSAIVAGAGTDASTTFELYNTNSAATIDGPDNYATWNTNSNQLIVNDVFNGPAADGHVIEIRVVRCDGAGTTTISSRQFTLEQSLGGDATGSTTTVQDEGAVTLNDNDAVCPGEQLDFAITGAAALGTNGVYRLYKTTDGVNFTLVDQGTDPLNVVNHDHGLVSATYHTVIFNDCDSIAVENITINVTTISSAPTAVNTSPMDATVCPGTNVTFTATGGTRSVAANGIYQYSTNGGAVWNPTGNAGTDDFITLAVNTPTTVLFRIQDDCGNYPAVAPFPQASKAVYTIATAPSGANAAPAGPICSGTDVTFTATGGSIAGANATYEYRVNAGMWTTTGNSGTDAFHTINGVTANTTVDFRIVDVCDPAVQTTEQSASVTVLGATDTPTFDSYEERDGVKGDATVMLSTAVCSGNDLVFNYTMGANVTVDDNPVVYIKVDGVPGAPVAVDGFAPSSAQEFVAAGVADGSTYQLFFDTDCISEVAISGAYAVTHKTNAANATDLTAVDETAAVFADGNFLCGGNGKVLTLTNGGTLGDADNYGNTPEYIFEVDFNGAAAWTQVQNGPASFNLDIDSLIAAESPTVITEIDVRSYIAGGCATTGNTNVFDINLFGGQTNFATISATHDNYCADLSATLPLTLTASGATLTPDGFSRIVWYSIDDLGNPVTKIKSELIGTANAEKVRFNQEVLLIANDAPDTTTTIGVRIESCDTSAFEVRTITVKDLPVITSAIASASPNLVCAGATSTLTLINYTIGTGGQVVWYADDEVTVLGAGPSYTTMPINTATTFKVRIEADCGNTTFKSVSVGISTVDPTNITAFNGEASTPGDINNLADLGTYCESDGGLIVTAENSTGQGSYEWEVSYNGGITFSGISDLNPGDEDLFFGFDNLPYDNNGEVVVVLATRRSNGCFTTDWSYAGFFVLEAPEDITSITASATQVCDTETSVTLTANGGDAGFDGEYRWTENGNPVPAWDGMQMVSINPSTLGAGVYNYAVVFESAACSFSTVAATRTVTVVGTPANDLGATTLEVCSNGSLDLASLSSYTGMNQSFSFTGAGIAGGVYTATNGSYPNATADNVETISYMVTDNGCSATYSLNINVYGIPQITNAVTTIASCSTPDGSIKLTTVGGTSPYQFSLNNPAGPYASYPADSITGVAGGQYDVYAMGNDPVGCISAAFSATVASASSISATSTIDKPVSCNGGMDGEITVDITDGLAPYDIIVKLNGVVQPSRTITGTNNLSETFTGLGAGTWTFEVTGSAGCTISTTKTLASPGQIGLTVSNFEEVDCFGEETGVIGNLSATSSNGGPFTFSLNNGPFTAATSYTDLAAGQYTITVKDGNGCTADFLFTLDQPDEIMLDTNVVALDQDGFDVQVVVNSGGVAPFEYRLNSGNYQTSNLFEDLPTGTYDFTVRDNNGCEKTMRVELRQPNSVSEVEAVFANVSAFPNPFSSEITVTGIVQGVEITLTDMYGKQVDMSAVIKDDKATISTGNIASGVYFVNFRVEGANKTIRVIKN